jgi:hypothetical protein
MNDVKLILRPLPDDVPVAIRLRAAPVVVLPWRTWSRILAALTSRDLVPPPFDTGAGI